MLDKDLLGPWFGLLLFAAAFVNLLLVYPLNSKFDPDWNRSSTNDRFFLRFMRTLDYSGAVVWKRGKRVIFGGTEYDFRAKISPLLRALCLLNQILAASAGVALFWYALLMFLHWIRTR